MLSKKILAAGLLIGATTLAAQTAPQAAIRIDAGKKLDRITSHFIGANLEDLNYQCYGGVYSQLLYAESFQEHIDSSVLGLSGKARLMVFVGENDRGEPVLWGFRGRGWQHNAAREALGLPLKTDKAAVSLDELPAEKRRILVEEAAGDRQVSRHWKAFGSGTARGAFRFERAAPFVGYQSQRITFSGGAGEVGIDNAGLNRLGINLVAGRPYEGMLRIKAERDTQVYVSLLDSSGSKKLAEKALKVMGGQEYRRLEFTMTPSGSDRTGRFAISLKQPASIVVGYAFLQPGPWGRYAGLPLRKDLMEALKDMGVTVMRYDGSMVSNCPDSQSYRWKEMIGPRDLRKPYRGFFNPYASHGFGIFDFLNMAEAAGFLPIPGIHIDETPEDMADLVEYVNGPAESKWGRQRAADGRPAPYNLKHIEIGNEQRLDEHYCGRFETLARAIWAKDRSITLVVTHNLSGPAAFTLGDDGAASEQLGLARRLVQFAKDEKGSIWWDCHYRAAPAEATPGKLPDRIAAMAALHESMRKLLPDYELPLAGLEENGPTHDLGRALAHARNQIAFARLGGYVVALGVANTFQAYDQELTWSQGKVHFTPSAVILQPPYYVDQIVSRTEARQTIETAVSASGNAFEATARITGDARVLALYAVNDGPVPIEAAITIAGFALRSPVVKVSELAGDPDSVNSPEQPKKITPRHTTWKHNAREGQVKYVFPAHSFTVLRFE
jgi:alpha-N-arabinofuranosidase